VTVSATDADVGANGQVGYSIVGGNTGGVFAVGESTGVITTVAPTCSDVQQLYELEVAATDRGDPPRSTQTVVNVTVRDALRSRS
jgi:protocadherin Fat 4